jgi:hypothetical protein
MPITQHGYKPTFRNEGLYMSKTSDNQLFTNRRKKVPPNLLRLR